jgi:hypothetical protein
VRGGDELVGIASFFGSFVLWGFGIWVGVLLILAVLDFFWTNGLATSWLQGTGVVLTQVWSALQAFLTFIQRVVAMAPRTLQIVFFILLGAVLFGTLTSWFLAADVVCSRVCGNE